MKSFFDIQIELRIMIFNIKKKNHIKERIKLINDKFKKIKIKEKINSFDNKINKLNTQFYDYYLNDSDIKIGCKLSYKLFNKYYRHSFFYSYIYFQSCFAENLSIDEMYLWIPDGIDFFLKLYLLRELFN